MPNIPLFTPQGKNAQTDLVLTPVGGGVVQITIGYEFAGRDVDEELDLSILERLGGEEPYRCNDLLGLAFETDGTQITGSVGAGSGNFGFLVMKEDWRAALEQLSASSPA